MNKNLIIEEYRNELVRTLSIKAAANELTEIKEKELEKNSARIFSEGKILSSNFLGKTSKENLKTMALANTHAAIDFDYELESNKELFVNSGRPLTDEEIVRSYKDLLDYLKEKMPHFTYGGEIEYRHQNSKIEVSNNVTLTSKAHISEGYLMLKRLGSPNIMDSFVEFKSGNGKIALSEIAEFINFHNTWDTKASISNGKHPVLFVDSSRDFLGKINESINAELYHQDAALFSGKKGKSIFNKKLNLIEITQDEKFGINKVFDDEATLCQKNYSIIKGGVFTGPLYDKKSAKKYNATPTGHASRAYNTSISISCNYMDFVPEDKNLKEIYSEHKEIIVVFMAGGGDTTSNGDFSSPVQLSFLVRDGKIMGRLNDLTMSNNITNMFNDDFITVSKERIMPSPFHHFMCYMNILN